jgi:phospholipid/cholesterol/gamma-HCH transport system permease protein
VPAPDDYQLQTQHSDGVVNIAVRGRVEVENAQRVLNDVNAAVADDVREVVLDLSGVDYFDSGGGAVLVSLRQQLAQHGTALRIAKSTKAIDGFLSLVDQEAMMQPARPARPVKVEGPVVRVGGQAIEAMSGWRDTVVFIGEIALGLVHVVIQPHRVRWRETWQYMERTGIDALPIVTLISFLMGLITAFQAAVQLQQFGADIFVANLVGLSITRELGPLMTAIIAAGRSGAAFAAEIGTMKVSDEVDALETMGFDRARFLVTPKVLALVLMLPCLTLFADLIGILGGMLVAVGILDLPAQVYFRQLRLVLTAWDVWSGLIKTLAFAVLIAGVGCLRGFQARTGAESVGRITTSAIVAGLFLIIITDAVFTVIFHYW